MSTPLLATKLYRPPPRPNVIRRPRLLERLRAGLHRKLTLISASAGFGKTTLISDWLADCSRPAVWLSLDDGDADPIRFLGYLVAAIQTLVPDTGAGVMAALYSPQPPPTEVLLTALVNDLARISEPFLLVLDDYHSCAGPAVDQALTFVLEHLPAHLHLVLATREDPHLPLARLRAQDQLSELRAVDLRFTPDEAAGFLHQVMGLSLSAEEVAALESRTEGWIAGLQLAGLSLQGQPDVARFIASFSGSHRFVLDYLAEEVLQQQPERIQTFLLQTSILERLCGPLCETVLQDPAGSGQATLEELEHANLFVIPLDNERGWYRYHHLFAELLRQRLQQSLAARPAAPAGAGGQSESELHLRASGWFEEHGLGLEAFQHAAAAQDIDRAARLLDGRGIPLHYRGAVTSVLDWLGSLPRTELESRPALLVRYASLLLVNGHTTGVDDKLAVAEVALQSAELDDATRNLIGHIAAARATVALTRYQVDSMLEQSRRALEYLSPRNLFLRANAYWTMGYAYLLQGERAECRRALSEAISLSRTSRDVFTTLLATIGLGNVQEADNQLHQAAETYRHAQEIAGEQPSQIVYEAHLGLARIAYEWNDLDAAEQLGQQSLFLARQYERIIDRWVLCEVFLARVKLARGDLAGAAHLLAQTLQAARQEQFVFRLPDIAAAQVVTWLRQGWVEAAAQLAETFDLPLGRARVRLAEGDPAAALTALANWGAEVEARRWADERLKVRVLQALAYQAGGETEQAEQMLLEALALGEPGGCVRTFVDEGAEMERLLSAVANRGQMPDYLRTLLAACEASKPTNKAPGNLPTPAQPLIDPLSHRELEVLRLIADGLSNEEIAERLYVALSTVKGHNRVIFDKLQVQRRTEAVARARELGLL
jgi:LuxR family transcriptional regulator, maltose regulon positive regulatory protein